MTDSVINIPGRAYAKSATLGDTEEFILDPQDTKTGAIEVHQIAHGGDCSVELVESSSPDQYNPDKRITLDSLTGEGSTMGNQIEASDQGNLYIVITNTSGSEADYIVTGIQVSL